MLFSAKEVLRVRGSSSESRFLDSFRVKRAMDLSGALVGLIVFAPLLVLSAVAIRLSGARRVIFRQSRVGLEGKTFKILKLTTMEDDAHLAGPLVSAGDDLRVTPVGRIIRGFCLNELPQLLNVLRGEMSLIGPRPEVPRFVEQWPEEIREKILSVRPGVTGLATMRIWDEAALLDGKEDVERAYLEEVLPRKLRVDLWYAGNRSLWLDVRILFLTLLKALGGRRLLNSTKGTVHVLPREEEA